MKQPRSSENSPQKLESKHDMEAIIAAMKEHERGLRMIYFRKFGGNEDYLGVAFDLFLNEVFLNIALGPNFSSDGSWIMKTGQNIANHLYARNFRSNRDRNRTKSISFSDGSVFDLEGSDDNPAVNLAKASQLEIFRQVLSEFRSRVSMQANIALDIMMEGLTGQEACDSYVHRVRIHPGIPEDKTPSNPRTYYQQAIVTKQYLKAFMKEQSLDESIFFD